MNSCIGWIGGKRALRKQIIELFPEDIGRYIEVFGGAGWVLFGKERKEKQLEVFNDMDGNLINLYRCIKYHCNALQDELQWLLSSREQYYDYKEQMLCRGLTDIQRAARYYYIIKISFGSDRRTFATSSKSIDNGLDYLNQIKDRLNGVVIEQKDFEDLIKVYDRNNALFYLDPPYVGTEKYYDVPFSKKDHERLKNTLLNLKGKFILSYNDAPLIRELYSGFLIKEVHRKNTLSSKENSKLYSELIITNFERV